ncbi:MAG: membrane dipeptidase [Deltaproteobacteria bacterium]|nr:membrane dipeptidase [Deltaproteobacteria bacterium]
MGLSGTKVLEEPPVADHFSLGHRQAPCVGGRGSVGKRTSGGHCVEFTLERSRRVEQTLVEEVHRSAYVADGHADSLMWNRDLSVRSERGNVDFPRLREGGVRLQCFTLVTRGLPVIGGFPLLARWNGWPAEALRSERARADWQIDQLERFCAMPESGAAIARSAAELQANLEAGRVSAVLGIEGAHALGKDLSQLESFYRRGVRFLSLTHLMHNEAGGSSFPLAKKGGLTGFGKEVLREMARLRMAVDVAHASRALLDEVLGGPAPVFCSHTGVASATKLWRNLPDDAIRAIASRGGLVCVIFAVEFLGGRTLDDLSRHLLRALEVAGEDHVGLGSDFDGMVRLPRPMRDARDLPLVTRALLERGVERRVIHKVLGGNLRRFLEAGPLA